ncbi:MAG: hypothetical protein ABII90_06240, partial [Bacteroidota bacterium]
MNKKFTSSFFYLLIVFFCSASYYEAKGQCAPCDPTVTTVNVDLSAQPDTIWSIDDIGRNDYCCGAAGSVRCIRFNITIHPLTEQIAFDVLNPAPPGGAFYQIDCGAPHSLADSVCVTGIASFCLVYCKAGGDEPTYTITAGRNTQVSPDITLNAGCTDTLIVAGIQESSVTWQSVFPGAAGAYDSWLSCTTNCDTTYVTAPDPLPGISYVDYEVTGTSVGCASGTSRDTVRVNLVSSTLDVQIAPPDPAICFGGTGVILTANGSGGAQPYTITWTGPDITPVGSTDSTSTIIAGDIGTYSVEVYDTTNCSPVYDSVIVVQYLSPISVDAGDDTTFVCTDALTASLSGTVAEADSGRWSSTTGAGVFIPSADSLTTDYTPDAGEIIAGEAILILESRGNRGCPADTDTIVITITIVPTVNANLDDTICESETYTLNGIIGGGATSSTWTTTGDGTFDDSSKTDAVYTPGAGDKAAGSVSLALTTDDPAGPCVAASDTMILVIESSPAASIIPDPAEVCIGVDLALDGNPAGGSGTYTTHLWTGDTGPLSATNVQSPTFNSAAAGIFNLTYTVTDDNGCSGSDNISVTVNTNPTAGITPDPAEVCVGVNLAMDGNPAGGSGTYTTHLWAGDTGPLSATNVQAPTFNSGAAGTFNLTYTVTDDNGCIGTDNISVDVYANPTAGITPDPAEVCVGVNLAMDGNPAGGSGTYTTHLWAGDTGPLSAINVQAPTFNSGASGTFNLTYTVTDDNGCIGTDNISVDVYANPTAGITPDPAEVCVGVNLVMDGNPAGGSGTYTTHLWAGDTGPLSAINVQAPTFNSGASGNFNLTYTVTDDNGCIGTDNISVTVNANPTAGITPDPAEVCVGVNLAMDGNPAGGSGTYTTHLWAGDTGPLSAINVQAPTFNSGAAGTFNLTYTVTDDNGCIGSDNISVDVYANPTAGITPDPAEVCVGVNLPMDGNPAGGSGTYTTHLWAGDTGPLSAINVQAPTFNSGAAGTFNLTYTVTDDNGCIGTDNISVTVNANPTAGITPDPAKVCVGVNLAMNGNPAGGSGIYTTHLWAGDTGPLSAINVQAPTFNSGASGAFNLTYTVTDDNGCIGTDNISVDVYANPTAGITPDPTEVCVGVNLAMDGNPAGGSGTYTTHLWAGATGPLSAINVQAPTFNSGAAGT